MRVEDFDNDVILAATCRGDVLAYCKNVSSSEWGALCMLCCASCAVHVLLRCAMCSELMHGQHTFCCLLTPFPFFTGEVHQCLRQNREQLTADCRREEMLLEQQEAEHISLRPGLLNACSNERTVFCDKVKGGNGRVFRCLADHLGNPDFGHVCRGEVISKLQRRCARGDAVRIGWHLA